MEVALATSAAPRATVFMTASGGKQVEGAAETTLPGESKESSVYGRYPVIALNFNADASRLVLQYRDPDTGKTVAQIPSEAALRQYEEAQKERQKERRQLYLVVGGASDDRSGQGGGAPTGVRASSAGPAATGAGTAPARTGGSGTSSDGVSAPAPASSSGSPTPGSTPGGSSVNVVI